MKFHVRSWRDIEAGESERRPVPNAYRETLPDVFGHEREVWIRDLNSLDDLQEFIQEYGRVVIEDEGLRTSGGDVICELTVGQDHVPPQTSH